MRLPTVRTKDLFPSSWYLRSFLLVGLVEAIGDIAIESILLAKFEFVSAFLRANTPDERTALPVYLSIFVLAHIFQITLAWEAVYNRNVIQIFGVCIFNLAFLVYAIIQISEIKSAFAVLNNPDHGSTVMVSVIPGIIAVAEVCYCYLSYHIYRLMGWEIFKRIGADRMVKRMYAVYQIFICMLKFDFFFFFAFAIQFVLLVLEQSDSERYLTVAACPISLILLYVAYYSVRQENRKLMYAVLATCLLAAAYFLFKLFRIYQGKTAAYQLVYKSLTVFSALSLALLLSTFVVALLCLRNFGFGLKQHLNSSRSKREIVDDDGTENIKLGEHYNLQSAASSRMSID